MATVAIGRMDVLAAADTSSVVATHPISRSDVLTASSAQSTVATHPIGRTDVLTASSAQSTVATHPIGRTDVLTASSAQSTAATHSIGRTDALSASDSQSTVATHSIGRTDALSASDSQSTVVTHPIGRSDVLSASDSQSTVAIHSIDRSDTVDASSIYSFVIDSAIRPVVPVKALNQSKVFSLQLAKHTRLNFIEAQQSLFPPGVAWRWTSHQSFSVGSRVGERLWSVAARIARPGYSILSGTSTELIRLEDSCQSVMDNAIEVHIPNYSKWTLAEYRRVALESIKGLTETLPRRQFRVGSRVGDRLWNSTNSTFPIDLLRVDHLVGPFKVGSKVGDALWGERGRYVLRVRYYRSVVNPAVVWDALSAFKQAHVFLFFEDISGYGGQYGTN